MDTLPCGCVLHNQLRSSTGCREGHGKPTGGPWRGTATVPGRARTKGSFRAFVRTDGKASVRNQNAHAHAWSVLCKLALRANRPPALLAGPVALQVRVYLARPRSHFEKDGRLREDAPEWPVTPPDIDKILRLAGDCLTGEWVTDDAVIVDGQIRKAWADDGPERVEVEAWAL